VDSDVQEADLYLILSLHGTYTDWT